VAVQVGHLTILSYQQGDSSPRSVSMRQSDEPIRLIRNKVNPQAESTPAARRPTTAPIVDGRRPGKRSRPPKEFLSPAVASFGFVPGRQAEKWPDGLRRRIGETTSGSFAPG
jgi:hypothetical protein